MHPLRSSFPFKIPPWHPTGWQAWSLPAHPSCHQLLSWFLIPLISPASNPSGRGRAGLAQGPHASLPHCVPNKRHGRAVPVLRATEYGNPASPSARLCKAELLALQLVAS